MGSSAKPVFFTVLACLSGGAAWFGVQAISGRDNFGDQVNPFYFLVLYVVAFLLGFLAQSRRINSLLVGGVLVLSQMPCYIIYPNIGWELGNMFPIAAAILLFLIAPAVLVAYLGSRLGRLCSRSDDPPGVPGK